MVSAKDAVNIYKRLSSHGIQVWLTGGWGIDALLGQQTRPHKDLDVIVLLDDVVPMCEILAEDGYRLKEIWSENRWVIDAHDHPTATAFVLSDSEGREFDAHAMRLDAQGNGIPAWAEAGDFILTRDDLSGRGAIAGFSVQCITPEKQVLCHTGYHLPAVQQRDLELLHQKFGLEYPGA